EHEDISQVHGFVYFEKENRISVDVVPDIYVTDEKTFAQTLTQEIQALYPNETVTVIVDHNYTA
ncbi:MAG: cation transporter, partial [Prevotella sp.]|nr:cation transporter [Prevotella sp.]